MWRKLNIKTILKGMRFWPPYLGAGISVRYISDDLNEIQVKMKLTPLNSNYGGVHFGGSLYSMCDPFFMFMLLHKLKKDHIVWDQAAEIQFVKPGTGTVTAKFKITDEQVEEIRKSALEQFSVKPVFECEVVDESGDTVAKMKKHLYIRRKDAKERFKSKPRE